MDDIFDGWNSPSARDSYAWKPRVIDEVVSEETNFIWIDAGALVCSSLQPIFDEIEISGHFLLQNYQHTNLEWTSAACATAMTVSENELSSPQVMGTFFGFSLGKTSGAELYSSWVKWCRNVNAVKGDRLTHRHDQTVLSILAARAKAKLSDHCKFMDIGRSNSDYRQAISAKITFLSHRNWIYIRENTFDNHSRLKDFTLFFRLLPRHFFRWKLHLVYWARWTPLGSLYVSMRQHVKILKRSK
jgi:hypothetical protein